VDIATAITTLAATVSLTKDVVITAKGIDDKIKTSEFVNKITAIQNNLLTLQSIQSSLITENQSLTEINQSKTKEIEKLLSWENTKLQYNPVQICSGVNVIVAKASEGTT